MLRSTSSRCTRCSPRVVQNIIQSYSTDSSSNSSFPRDKADASGRQNSTDKKPAHGGNRDKRPTTKPWTDSPNYHLKEKTFNKFPHNRPPFQANVPSTTPRPPGKRSNTPNFYENRKARKNFNPMYRAHRLPAPAHQVTKILDKPYFPRAPVDIGPPGEMSLEEDDNQEDLYGKIPPGSFVEIRKNEMATPGIVLSEVALGQKWTVLTLTERGNILSHFRADVYFAIPNLISVNEAERCGYTLAVTPEQTAARVDALMKLKTMVRESTFFDNKKEKWFKWNQKFNIYNEVRSRDPTRWGTAELSFVTSMLFPDPTFYHYYMAHRILMSRPIEFVPTSGYLKTQTFAVRPLRDVEEIIKVQDWIDLYREDRNDGPCQSFFVKASRLIEEYDERQKMRQATEISQEPANVTWDENDKVFLQFLIRSLQRQQSNQPDPYDRGRTYILRHIIPQVTDADDGLAHEVLIKLGVLAPWQDLFELYDPINPTGDLTSCNSFEKDADDLLAPSLISQPTAGKVLGPTDLIPTDPLESVRHDFGNAKVYVIDSATAEELDDGISLERIPSEPGNHWVHIHIADPTSVLHPGHALSLRARKLNSTKYLVHNTYPMLPGRLVFGPEFGLSLASTLETGEPARVMSFSVKLDEQGSILDHKVRAGIIRNVRKVTYETVDSALGLKEEFERFYPFGGKKAFVSVEALPEDEVADLKIVKKLARKQVEIRMSQGRYFSSAQIQGFVHNSPIPKDIHSPTLDSAIFHGFPDMTYSVRDNTGEVAGSRELVSEMMKLASRVASRFALDHNLPFVRRTAETPYLTHDDSLETILKERNAYGYAPMQRTLSHVAINPLSGYTLEPKQHHPLAIPDGEGYSRVTSPLRRFSDMVAHWQLQHALLGPNAPPRSPFSLEDLDKYCVELHMHDMYDKKIGKKNEMFHALLFLKRWHLETLKGVERPLGNPLTRMNAYTLQLVKRDVVHHRGTVMVHIPVLGLSASLINVPLKLQAHVPLGHSVIVKIKEIYLGIKRSRFSVELAEPITGITVPEK